MPDITAAMVKALREATGAGMMDCKKALIESDGDAERAAEILREKGLAGAAKRAGRSAKQGLVDSYIHFNDTVGVLIEVNCETDFVANTDVFRGLVKDLALHIASPSAPRWLSRDDVPVHVLEHERRIFEAQAAGVGQARERDPPDRGGQDRGLPEGHGPARSAVREGRLEDRSRTSSTRSARRSARRSR